MSLPWLALGCHNLTGGGSWLRSARLVACALDHGITRFDVAPLYGLGTAEATLGRALGRRRHDPAIAIASKFGLLPPRGGWAKAWLREPWRLVRGMLPQRPAVRQSVPNADPAAGLVVDPTPPRVALERSLRAIGVERLDLFLTHEAVPNDRRGAVLDGLADLVCAGLIGRAGFSGEQAAVAEMIAADRGGGPGIGALAQVALNDFAGLPPDMAWRGFRLSRLALAIRGEPDLRRSLGDVLGRDDPAAALSAAFALAHRACPDAVLLVNASSAARLGEVLAPLASGALDGWAAAHAAQLARLAGWAQA